MARLAEVLPDLRAALLGFGPPRSSSPTEAGSPGNPFDRLAAVLIGQEMDPRRAERVLAGFREAGLLDPRALGEADPSELAGLVPSGRSSSVPPRWLAPLQRLARWFEEHGKDLDSVSTSGLRANLRAIRGLGPRTVDALLLFGLNRPVAPVDRATYRVLVRHGWLDPTADYDEASSVLLEATGSEPAETAWLTTALEQVGGRFCRVSGPRCDACPLRPWLPRSGPIEPDA